MTRRSERRARKRLAFLTAVIGLLDLKWGEVTPGAVRVLGDTQRRTLTPAVIEVGIERVLNGWMPIRADLAAEVKWSDRENTVRDLSREAADVIVQAALFGEVYYDDDGTEI